MSGQFDQWLCQRAAAGDQPAFEALIRANRTKLRNVAQTFTGSETAVDDLEQIAILKLWTEVQRGHYNPHRGAFIHFASTVFHQALNDDKVRRRASKRWTDEPPRSLDLTHDDSDAPLWIAPSWHLGADPLQVVCQRETIKEAWQTLTAAQVKAVNTYLATDGVGAASTTATAFHAARKRVAPLLAATMATPIRLT